MLQWCSPLRPTIRKYVILDLGSNALGNLVRCTKELKYLLRPWDLLVPTSRNATIQSFEFLKIFSNLLDSKLDTLAFGKQGYMQGIYGRRKGRKGLWLSKQEEHMLLFGSGQQAGQT